MKIISGFPLASPARNSRAARTTRRRSSARKSPSQKVPVGSCAPSRPYAVETGSDAAVPARTVIIATGAEYRKLPLDTLSQFEGVGVYYAATFMESQVCGGDEVIVVGGGNSAGQAAVFLARTAKHVHLLIRSDGLAESMSKYLIRRIEETPAITLHTQAEITALEGERHLECAYWRDNETGTITGHDIRHIFVMTGASPATQWLAGCVILDAKGFIKTGPDLSPEELAAARWPLTRPPPSFGNEPARSVRGRRYSERQHQARGVRRRRGVCGGLLRSSGA